MLLAIIPVIIIGCFICICKLTGFSLLPKELSTENKQFQFPKLKRTPEGNWVVEEEEESEDEDYYDEKEDYDEEEEPLEPPYDPKLDEFTKPLKRRRKKPSKRKKRKQPYKRPPTLNQISPNDPSYRILYGGLYD